MKTILLEDALAYSCDSGFRFLRKMFTKYGNGKELRITENMYNKIVDDFIKYHKTTKISDIQQIDIQVHLWCFLDDIFIQHFKIKLPGYWKKIVLHEWTWKGTTNESITEEVRNAGWRVLQRCIK
jgi:hypothetical protein